MKSLFDQEEIKQAYHWSEIFIKFLNISESSLQEVANIIDNSDVENIPTLCHFLYLSIEFRPFKSFLYTKLLFSLKSSDNNNLFYRHFLNNEIFSPSIYSYFPNSAKYPFLFDCLNYDSTKQVFKISEVYTSFKKSIECHHISNDEIFVCFAWLAPELQAEYESKSAEYGENGNISKIVNEIFKNGSSSIENVHNFYSNFKDYEKDNFKKLREERLNPLNDEIKQKIISKSPFNLNYQFPENSKEEELKITDEILNKTIIFSSIFERCQYKFVNPTILQYCSYFNCYDIFDELIEKGANDDINDTAGNTLAQYSISGVDFFESKSESFIKKIERKIDFRLTPEMATELNQNKIFHWLVDSVYYFKYMEQAILNISSSYSNLEILLYVIENTSFLIEKKIHIDFETPLFEASQNGNVEVVKLLLPAFLKYNENKNINFVKNEMNLFYAAFLKRRFNVLNYFLNLALNSSEKVNPNFVYRGKQALMKAVELNQVDIIHLLLKFPDIDPNVVCGGMTPLHKAAKDGNIEIVKILLDFKGTNPNVSTVFTYFFLISFFISLFE